MPNQILRKAFKTVQWRDVGEFPQLKSKDKYIFISCERDDSQIIEFAKVADVIINLSDASFVNYNQLNVNPKDHLNAIDD